MTKVTFVMPCYNKASYISDTLKGILAQTLKEWECICVNDKSTDGTDEIIEYYAKKDKRIKCHHLQTNMGMSYARNYGIDRAKSKIILSHDADDISHPSRAKMVYDYFQKHDVDLVYSGFYAINQFGHVLREYEAVPFSKDNLYKRYTTFMGHPTFAYKKSVIKKFPYQDGKWSRLGCEDYRLILDLTIAKKKIGMIAKPLVFYRQLDSSSTFKRDETEVLALKRKYLDSLGVQHGH